jgi:hypothetical protein
MTLQRESVACGRTTALYLSGDILASVPTMTTVLRVALMATLFATRCLAQTGTVTFYTPGNSAKSVAASLLPKSQQPFTGWLFDGPQRLVTCDPAAS